MKLFLVICLSMCMSFCSLCDAVTTNEIKDRGVIRIGTAGDYCPMSFLNPETKKYEGFDADLAEDLAAALDVKIDFVPTSWPTLMDDIEKFDLAICGITITEARKEQALMSNGYLVNGKTILIRAEDVDKYKTLSDVNQPDVVVMENPGGTNEKFARANLPNAKIIIHNVNEEIPGLIAQGKADVMITEIAEAGYYTKRDKRLAAPLLTKPFSSGEIGVLISKNSPELLEFVNAFLVQEEQNGRLDELRRKYIFQSNIATNATTNAEVTTEATDKDLVYDSSDDVDAPISNKSLNMNGFLLLINTDGLGQIAYAEEGRTESRKAVFSFNDEYPVQSTVAHLAGGTKLIISAKSADGWKFIKWTLNGEDYSNGAIIHYTVTKDSDFKAVFRALE